MIKMTLPTKDELARMKKAELLDIVPEFEAAYNVDIIVHNKTKNELHAALDRLLDETPDEDEDENDDSEAPETGTEAPEPPQEYDVLIPFAICPPFIERTLIVTRKGKSHTLLYSGSDMDEIARLRKECNKREWPMLVYKKREAA
jgi:hypothetical protein